MSFDAYFSNFIEGTEFEVEEAREIVIDQKIPTMRPLDAHDVLGTFAVVGQRSTMRRRLRDDRTFDDFAARRQALHAQIMEQRKDKRPGEYKTESNRVGDTRFVEPETVLGTLRYGLEMTRALATPFQRAVSIMFVLSEIHPFDDGNDRVARAFMNAELVAGGEARMIIPTVYRDDYLTGLRTLSRAQEPNALIKVLDFEQRWVAAIDWSSFSAAEQAIVGTSAIVRPSSSIVLRLPARDHTVSRGTCEHRRSRPCTP
jgi:Fic family protein